MKISFSVLLILVFTILNINLNADSTEPRADVKFENYAPSDLIVYFNYNSKGIPKDSEIAKLINEIIGIAFSTAAEKTEAKGMQEAKEAFNIFSDFFNEIISIDGGVYLKAITIPDQQPKLTTTIASQVTVSSVDNFKKLIDSSLSKSTTVTKETENYNGNEILKLRNQNDKDTYVDFAFISQTQFIFTISNDEKATKDFLAHLATSPQAPENKSLKSSKLYSVASTYSGDCGVYVNFNQLWSSQDSLMQFAFNQMQGAQGPAAMFLPMIISTFQKLLGDIGLLGFAFDIESKTQAQNFIVSFNSANYGLLDVVNGQSSISDIHISNETSLCFVTHFSYQKLFDLIQKIADSFAPMMGGEPMDLSKMIEENTGENIKEAIINNLAPLVIVYNLKSSADPIPVIQLPAANPARFVDFCINIIEFSQGMSGTNQAQYDNATISGRTGIALPLPDLGKKLAIVKDDKSVYIGLEESLKSAFDMMTNMAQTGCTCCSKEFRSMIPENSSSYYYITSGFTDKYFEMLKKYMANTPNSDQNEQMAELIKTYELLSNFRFSGYGYGKFEGNNYIFTQKWTMQKK